MQDYPANGVLLVSIVLVTLIILRAYQKLFRVAEKRSGEPFPLGVKVAMVMTLPVIVVFSFTAWLVTPDE